MTQHPRLIRSGGKRPWWAPLAIVGYLGVVMLPCFYAAIVVWESSGADIVGQPVKETRTGTVQECHKDGLLFVNRWWECDVNIDPPPGQTFKTPVVVAVAPPDLEPSDTGKHVTVERRVVRGSTEYTLQRDRPADVIGFVGSILLLLVPAAGMVFMLRGLQRMPSRR